MMDDGVNWAQVLVLLSCAAVVLFLLVGWFRGMNPHVAGVEHLAGLLRGRCESGGPFGEPWIELSVGGRGARLEFIPGGRFEMPSTRLTVDMRNSSPGWLHILPNNVGIPFLKRFGEMRDLTIGDPIFDSRYVVASTPNYLAERVFRPDQRSRVIATVLDIADLYAARIDLDKSYLTIQATGYLTAEHQAKRLLKAAEEFLGHLFREPPVEGLEIGELSSAEGQCNVCGTGLAGSIVRCESCRTPHHEECWTYVGQCSTYACKGKRCVA